MDQLLTGQFIKALRKERGLTQKELAERLNVSEKTVSKWETGNGLPDVGLIKLKDAETEERVWFDTSDKRLRKAYRDAWGERMLGMQQLFVHAGVDYVSISTADDYVRGLMQLFRMRSAS